MDHRALRELPSLLRPGDLLVVNDTRVIPARLAAVKPTGGRIEVLLIEPAGQVDEVANDTREEAGATTEEWLALVRGFGRQGEAARFTFPGGLAVEVVDRGKGDAIARVILTAEHGVRRAIEATGAPPTPPYVRRGLPDERLEADRERYQTVYAASSGAVAAPTAGLHFTRGLLKEIEESGVGVSSLTLHVGWGTFQPVRVERVEDHRVAAERFVIPENLAAAFDAAKRSGGRVVAVGTTVARALEFAARDAGGFACGGGWCDLFIHPGHRFRAVDALITNFHLPASSLLILVAAFAGRERVLDAYREAIARKYRFYSYGDAMFIA